MYEYLEVLAWIPLAAAGLTAAASLGGGIMSAQGAASANAQNVAAQNMANQQMLNAQMATHAQNTAFMEDQQNFGREERQFAENFSSHQAQIARDFSSNEARTQRDFQEYMAGTAYQRAMIDMKKAGLNPLLAYQQGGAATPGGAMGSSPSPTSSGASSGMASGPGAPNLKAPQVLNTQADMGRAVGNMVSSAMDTMKTFAGIDYMKEQAKSEELRQPLLQQQTGATREQKFKTHEEIEKVKSETRNVRALLDYIHANTAKTKSEAGITAKELIDVLEHGSKYTPQTLERIFRAIGSGPGPVKLPEPMFK